MVPLAGQAVWRSGHNRGVCATESAAGRQARGNVVVRRLEKDGFIGRASPDHGIEWAASRSALRPGRPARSGFGHGFAVSDEEAD